MRLLNFAIIKLTLFLVLGILFAYFFEVGLNISAVVSFVFLTCLTIIYITSNKKLKTSITFGVIALVVSFSIGILAFNIHEQRNWKTHYSQLQDIDLQQTNELSLKVIEALKSSLYQDKYFAKIYKVNNRKVTGKILLNIDKDSLNKPLKADDIIYTKAPIVTIAKPLNPHQFDYSNYLDKKYVYHQIYLSNKELLIQESSSFSIKGMAEHIRGTINVKLNQYDFDEDQLAIINAILLGQKKDLSKDIYQQYADAGVIHILAVSGLHVGIILIILQLLLKPLEYIKRGRLLKTIIIVFLLWCFAIIAGLSPSVVRAVTMFSIVAIGLNMKRPTNIFNTLAISMFILLLFKPVFLFDVGFQLSYLAVFAIVWIQPMLYKSWSPKYTLIDYFWKIFTVTIAAQIGVAPLSLFYFHQFPGLFFIANLVIIPFLGLILGLGILVIFLASFDVLPELIVNFYGGIITTLNNFVRWIAEQEAFLFKGISFGIIAMLLSYLLIVFGVQAIQKKAFKRLAPFLFTILIIQGFAIYSKSKFSHSLTVFNKSRHSILAYQNNHELKVFHSMDSTEIENQNILKNYIIGENIKEFSSDTLSSVYKVNDKLLLVIDSIPTYKIDFKPDLVLLRNSPKVNLERLINFLEPKLIIADGSNYKSYVARWEETCKHKKLPFHATAKKGALIIDYAK